MSLIIPADALSATALNNLIDAFILREGTDYGLEEHSLKDKRDRCREWLFSGKAQIHFDPDSESFTIQAKDA
tara:strand:- start:1587 stop:1802 length:216 start_codon:yes stop_codon:yes gene_type:complete